MSLTAGARLGPYEVLSPLGAGGMGEVYRAKDGRLNRTVAIKILSDASAADADRRERFEREAKAISALDHPNICPLYDVGEHEGTYFLVMPCLEGETLADRLGKGALPIDQAIKHAIEIATALDAAHRHGIIHRDLKPANIMLTKTGVKLLDFGLAKLKRVQGPLGDTTLVKGTGIGTLLGTMPYMAPEQVEGREVDARSDIFSLGAVIYEMVTGHRAFKGESPASVIGAILKDQPASIASVQPVAPAALDHVVMTCLAKEPDERWQSAADIARQLKWVTQTPVPAGNGAMEVPRRVGWTGLAIAMLIGIGAGALGLWSVRRYVAPASNDRLVVREAARITNETGFSEWPSWSSDGTLFAYSSNRNGNYEIHVRRADGSEDVNVTHHDADDVQPALAPDGRSIAFVSTRSSRSGLQKIGTFIGFDTRTYGGDIWVTPVLGGQARRVATDGNFPVWHPGGQSLLYVSGRENQRTILAVPSDGGPITEILPASATMWEITRVAVAPKGNWITFETADREIFAMPAVDGRPVPLFRGSSHVWDPSGDRIYYVNQGARGGSTIEIATLSTAGPLAVDSRLTASVSTGTLKDLAIAGNGQRLIAVGIEESLNLSRVRLAEDGGEVEGVEEILSHGQVRDRYPRVSPDGRRVALGSNRIGHEELWLVDINTRQWQRVEMPSDAAAWVSQACWAGDGQHLMVMRYLFDRTVSYWYVALDGSSAERLLSPMPGISGNFACSISPDGRAAVYSRIAGSFSQLFVLDLTTRTERQLTTSPMHKYEGTFSPDGRWVAFSANADGAVQIHRVSASGGDEQALTTGGGRKRHLFYSPDGRWLYVQQDHRNIHRMPADGGPLRAVTNFPESGLFIEEPTISPDGRWLVYNKGGGGSSLWMLSLGPE